MKKIALITALLLSSNVALANDSYWGQIIGGVAGGVIGNQLGGSTRTITTAIGAVLGSQVGQRVQDNMRYNEYARQPVVVQNNAPIVIQQHPNVNRRAGVTPIYQWQDIADDNCGCIRRVLIQIN